MRKLNLKDGSDIAYYICQKLVNAFEDVIETPGLANIIEPAVLMAGLIRPAVLFAVKLGITEKQFVNGARMSYRVILEWPQCPNPDDCAVHEQARWFLHDDTRKEQERPEVKPSRKPSGTLN